MHSMYCSDSSGMMKMSIEEEMKGATMSSALMNGSSCHIRKVVTR